ncbi:MAG: ArnT family glycosyltransferase [Kiritimatiellia bacterium]|jgi:hypothetical protein
MLRTNIKHPIVWLSLITLLGLILRLTAYWQGGAFAYFTFGDEILAYDRALDYAMGVDEARYLSQAKFSPNSYTPGALWTVFWLNAMRLGGGPHAVAMVMLLLNTAVIIFVYMLASRLLGQRGGLWAALFMATQPWAVYYSVGAYNPEILAFFSSLTFLALWETVNNDRSPHIFWVGLLPIMAMQFHASAGVMLVGTLAVLGLTRRKLHWPAWLMGLLTGMLFYLPYIQGDAANGWANTRMMFGDGDETFSFGCLKAITTPFSLLTSWCARWTLPDFRDYLVMGNAVCGSYVIMFAFKALGTAVMLICLWQFIRAAVEPWRGMRVNPRAAFAHNPSMVFLTALLLIPLLVFLLSGRNYSSRYGIFLLPILMMIPAQCLTHCTEKLRHKKVFYGAVIITVVFNVYFTSAFFHYQGRLIAGADKFLPSFRNLAQVYEILEADAGAGRPIIVHDQEFLKTHHKHDASAISMYVSAREKEARMRSEREPISPVLYDLREVEVDHIAAVAWQHADVMLVRRGESD